jgi:hypothetical protein
MVQGSKKKLRMPGDFCIIRQVLKVALTRVSIGSGKQRREVKPNNADLGQTNTLTCGSATAGFLPVWVCSVRVNTRATPLNEREAL